MDLFPTSKRIFPFDSFSEHQHQRITRIVPDILFHLIGSPTYIRTSGKNSRLRLKSGGHGQTGMNELKKYGIKYNIVKTFPNGVRVGNIPDHKDKRKQTGTKQAWFPETWKSKDIRHAGEHVAGLKKTVINAHFVKVHENIKSKTLEIHNNLET